MVKSDYEKLADFILYGHRPKSKQKGVLKMGKKNKKSEKVKFELVSLEGVSNAKIVKTIEDWARQESIPADDYFYECKSGRIKVRKSEGAGRISWQIDGKQITRSNLYKMTKDAILATPEEEPKGGGKKDKKKKDKKGKGESENSEDDGPTTAETSKTYKKKQLLNIITEGQLFKKKIVKAVKAAIPEKKITGASFIAVLDDTIGKTTPIKTINIIFNKLKE